MRKYITIPDFRDMPSYKNENARLLYLHIAMSMEVKERTYVRSIRQLAADLGLSVRQVRTALDALERDGLIKTEQVTHMVSRMLTHVVTQMVTQITVLSISDLNTEGNTEGDTDADTHADTHADTQKNNINNKNNKTPSLTSACVAWADMREVVKQALQVDAATAAAMVDTFKERQGMKGKTWKDEGDLKAHLISFAEKRLASLPRGTKGGRQTDAQARQQEYARAQEAQEAKGEKEKAWESVQDAWRWWKEAEKKAAAGKSDQEREKAAQQAAAMKAAYERLKQEWYNKFKST